MEVRDKIVRAYKRLITNDSYLLENDVNERSITHHLAIYIQDEFPEYHVDCEYNRNGLDVKKLMNYRNYQNNKNKEENIDKEYSVYPDIIVHCRNKDNNYIIIEAKKISTKEECLKSSECCCDKCKLEDYKRTLKYTYAFYVLFPTGKKIKNLDTEKLTSFIEIIE